MGSGPMKLGLRAEFWKWTLSSPDTPSYLPARSTRHASQVPANPHRAVSKEHESHRSPTPRPGLALRPAPGRRNLLRLLGAM